MQSLSRPDSCSFHLSRHQSTIVWHLFWRFILAHRCTFSALPSSSWFLRGFGCWAVNCGFMWRFNVFLFFFSSFSNNKLLSSLAVRTKKKKKEAKKRICSAALQTYSWPLRAQLKHIFFVYFCCFVGFFLFFLEHEFPSLPSGPVFFRKHQEPKCECQIYSLYKWKMMKNLIFFQRDDCRSGSSGWLKG